MATAKNTGTSTVKSTSTIDSPLDYSSDFTTKFTYTESTGAGANAFTIHSDTTAVALSLKGTSGDILIINGYSGDYTAKLSGTKLTLDNNNQIITVALTAKSIVTLKFLDGSKDVNLTEKTLGGDSLLTKSGVLHINGMNSHELTSVTTAVNAALTDVNKKHYATVDAAIISDNAVVKSTALTDKSGKSYATVDLAITSNDAAITTQALTDTTVTPNVVYPNLNAAILSNDQAIISKALVGTNFSSIADLVAAYNKFALQSLATFKVESLDVKMVPASAVSVSEGATAYFKVSLTNRVSGDYSVKTMLTGTLATPDSDFVNSLTLDSASLAAGIKFNPATGILTIPASSQSISAILSTTIKNDTVSPEAGEKVNLAISDAQGTSVAPLGTTDIASVTILDVIPPTFSVTANTGPVLEGTSTTFTVNLANHTVGDYSVKVVLTGNNANLNSDFSALTLDPTTPAAIKFDSIKGILTIPADTKTTSVKFNTNINTDNRAETGQSVTLALSQDTTNPSNTNTVIASTASSTTAVISEVLPPTFAITADSINEGTTASFNITLINNPDPKSDYSIKATLGATGASVLGTDFSGTLTLDSASIAAGIKFDSITGLLTIPATTIVAANTAKQTVKATLTTTTNPDNVASVKGMSLVLSTSTGTNVAAAPAPATIDIINVPATLLTTDIDTITTPDNSNTLIMANTLTINANATSFDSVKDNGINDNDVMNIITNSWPVSPAKTILIDKIETINLTALDTITVDNSTISGVNNFNIKNSTAAVTLDKINSASTILGLEGALVNNLTAKYKTAPKITDTLTVTLNNATNAIFTLDSTILLDKGFGFAELSVLNTSTLTSFDGKVSTLTISGTGSLAVATDALSGVNHIELTDPNIIKFGDITTTKLNTFKAPANTGGISTGLIQGATGGFTMQLGSGADSIKIQDNTTDKVNINNIRLGMGDDTLSFTSPTIGKTYIYGDIGNDTINVKLTPGADSSSIAAAGSSDSINTVEGGDGNDTITLTLEPNTVNSTAVPITSIKSHFFISGGEGSDFIYDSLGSDTIDGGNGNNTIYGGGGNDVITTGNGRDIIYVNDGGTAIINAGDGVDTIYGGTGDDTICTTIAQLFSNNSVIDGIDGGNGIDSLLITDADKYISITSSNNFGGIINVEKIKVTATSFDININIGSSNNANTQFDTIDLSGDTNSLGKNTINVIDSNLITSITGSAGIDYINLFTSAPAATLQGGEGQDFFSINNNATDTITDLSGIDSISVSSNSTVNATVTANYTASNSSNLGQINITTNGFSVNMSAQTGTGLIRINNTGSGTRLSGGAGNDTITGGTGADTITGGTGADTITGGAGGDIINGGIGNDTYVISSATGDTGAPAAASNAPISSAAIDVITVTAGDKVDLTASLGTDANYVNVVTTTAASYTALTGIDVTSVYEVRGTYNAGTSSFTAGDTGTDVLLYWGSANATTADQEIILVGTGSVADTILGGILTIA